MIGDRYVAVVALCGGEKTVWAEPFARSTLRVTRVTL
jgi:hypothetical protein